MAPKKSTMITSTPSEATPDTTQRDDHISRKLLQIQSAREPDDLLLVNPISMAPLGKGVSEASIGEKTTRYAIDIIDLLFLFEEEFDAFSNFCRVI
jgi:hypothetical protein